MQLERTAFRPAQLGKSALAGLLILTVLFSLLLSASPSLHEHVHHDATQASHECAITVFQKQQLLASNPNILIVEQHLEVSQRMIATDCTAVSDFDYRFSASRAPPFILSPLV